MLTGLLTHAKVMLRGPDLNTMTEVAINSADGTFTTGEALQAGSYQIELPATNEMVAAALATAGVGSVGDAVVVTVGPGMKEPVNFPFRITIGAAEFSFDGVADGEYKVVLEANAGSWEEDDVSGIEVMHDEENDDADYTGAVSSGNDLSATDLRETIKGRSRMIPTIVPA